MVTGINQSFTKFSRLAVLFCIYILLLQNALFSVILANSGPQYSLFLVQSLPLLAMLPGIIRGIPRSYQWICFLIMFYFINAILNVFTPGTQLKGWLEAIYCVLLFSSAIVFVNSSRKSSTTSDKGVQHGQ